MSAKEVSAAPSIQRVIKHSDQVVQVSAIVQKLEKERHLKRVLASNTATGTGAVASSESLSSAKSQSTSLDHVAANPSTSTTTTTTTPEP
ncbi:hypothetical protein HDU99_010014, partial [Rhizoclosmatium hyalinum]